MHDGEEGVMAKRAPYCFVRIVGDTAWCSQCQSYRPFSDFNRARSEVGGLHRTCKACKSAWAKKFLADPRNKARHLAYHKRYRATYPERVMVAEAKQRAKDRGLPFSITAADILIPKLCPVFKVPLAAKESGVRGLGIANRYCMSLDMIDPTKGYVPGNVQVISGLANAMKNNASREELVLFAQWVLSEFTAGSNGKRP